GAESRFLEEARITSRLQHPGIPPVHEFGRLDDGRPFLAMKLIEGRTLHELLKQRASPANDQPRFVAIFGQGCQAVVYAHSRGVIHRDLKPHNVMVGAFGEVQVMDWGLAKERGARGAEGETGECLAVAPDATSAGTVLGTLGFMAPEQARGEINRLDQRADVFGLGAVLCVVVTGQPPFVGTDGKAVHLESASGDLAGAFSRLDACAADGELIALAKHCLAPDPEQRPRDATAVAEAVVAYQAGGEERARKAEAAPAGGEEGAGKGAAERRARRLTLGLAAALVLVLGLGAGGSGAVWLWQQAEQARSDADVALEGEQQAKEGEAIARQQVEEANEKLEQVVYLRRV